MLYTYDSISDLLGAAFAVPVAPQPCVARFDCNLESPRGFLCQDRTHLRGFNDAREAMAAPLFPSGVARIERLSQGLAIPTPNSIARRIVRGPEGDELCMQRVYQGDLDRAWSSAKRVRAVKASRVLVCVFVGAPGTTDSDELAWRGVAGLALANALEAAGYSVELRAIRRAELRPAKGALSDPRHDINLTIKAAGQPLDLHKAASLVASPLLFRGVYLRHAFAVATLRLTEGVSGTDYNRESDVNSSGFDYTCVAGHAVTGATKAQAWIAQHVKALDTANE